MKPPPRPQDETTAETKPARLRLYNTLTRGKEDFAPIDPKAVRLYVAAPRSTISPTSATPGR